MTLATVHEHALLQQSNTRWPIHLKGHWNPIETRMSLLGSACYENPDKLKDFVSGVETSIAMSTSANPLPNY